MAERLRLGAVDSKIKNKFQQNLSKKRSNLIVTLLTLYSRHKGEEEEGVEIGAEGAGEGRRRW